MKILEEGPRQGRKDRPSDPLRRRGGARAGDRGDGGRPLHICPGQQRLQY